MPRDGSGVYTLPAGNPVVTNTTIASVWANSTMSDIAAQLNNVLTRDGLLGPTGPFKLQDGTVAAPGLAFSSEAGLGMYRRSAGQIGWAALGETGAVMDFNSPTSTSFRLYSRSAGGVYINLANGTTASPNYNLTQLAQNPDGTSTLQNVPFGTATKKAMLLAGAASYSFDAVTSVTTSGLQASISVNDAGAGGAGLQFFQNSGSAKFIRCLSNSLEILNSAYSRVIMAVADNGRIDTNYGWGCKNGTVGSFGPNVFNMSWGGPMTLWVDNTNVGTINVTSDERIKKNIRPLDVHEDAFMALRPIEYEFNDVGIWRSDGINRWGFSAQNVKQTLPNSQAAFGDDGDMPTDNDQPWAPLAVDDRPILALTVRQVQDLINRVKALESK